MGEAAAGLAPQLPQDLRLEEACLGPQPWPQRPQDRPEPLLEPGVPMLTRPCPQVPPQGHRLQLQFLWWLIPVPRMYSSSQNAPRMPEPAQAAAPVQFPECITS